MKTMGSGNTGTEEDSASGEGNPAVTPGSAPTGGHDQNQIVIANANAEPYAITRAKAYIQDHYSEDISLGRVAMAVHMNTFYFCKMFKRSTGINFNEFISLTRTAKAKHLLCNRNLRICEVAFEVGFQSLTHFNRIFKKLVGQSPTEYRDQLPAEPAAPAHKHALLLHGQATTHTSAPQFLNKRANLQISGGGQLSSSGF